MDGFQGEVNQVVQRFVAEVAELARRAALEMLAAAFGGGAAGPTPTLAAAPVAAPAAAQRRAAPRVDRGAKRPAAELDALRVRLAAFVKAHPGLRIEQMNKQLGTTTKDLALPMRKLIAEGQVSPKGRKRSTTYFPGRKAKR